MFTDEELFELAASFLEDYSDRLSNAGCNDYRLPEGWSQKRKNEVMYALEKESDPDYFDEELREKMELGEDAHEWTQDWLVVKSVTEALKKRFS